MASRNNIFTTIRTEGALLPADLLQRISEGANLDGLTPESYHRPGEKLNEAINRSWNALQGVWASFRAAQERLPENDLGTSITRERWLLPLFRELDYGRLQTATAVEIDGRSYPISHGWEHVPVHLVSYKLELDRRTPGAAGAASASPHSLLQVFLNRSENNLWGFLSNGYKLRILRDNVSLTRQAYVEFDLEAMMEGEVYSDFVLLWLLCHQSRVEGERPSDCWLEKWMKVAEDQGTRALDQLRDGVEQAIEALGLGFLEYHANAALRDKLTSGELTAQDYYRQLLRMVYRLLFLFVAEDRELLLNPDAPQDARERYVQFYSTQRLRRMAETFKGTRHPDLFEGLRLVMRLLSGEAPTPVPSPSGGWQRQVSPHEGERFREGAAGLGLVPLGSYLFSDRAVTNIIDCQISNQRLLTAVRALSLTYDQRAQVYRTVDYKNLGSDELGSIFESLLELHPQINVPARRFVLETAAGNERKTTGSYYTPESLVHALLDSALNPVLEEAIRGTGKAPTPGPSPSGGGEKVREMATEAMRDIARNLRQRQTPAETVLWEALRKNRLGGLGFRRQHPIANTSYVVDFFCYAVNLIVELDGGIHQFQQKADSQRQSELESLGYRFLRFPNQRVTDDLENVLIEILNAANALTPGPSGRGENTRANKSPHLRGGDLEGGLTAEQRILNLKVCDPACGSGHFLIAAANRMAKALAFVRTGEEEPPPAAIQEAKRDIISHCIYGVDINPMAVELCKVNLWMEALEPGKPLNFLDHRIQVGNSLLGTTPKLMAGGIPDDAFNPIEGDDPKYVTSMKRVNREERKQREAGLRQLGLFDAAPAADYSYLTEAMHALDDTPDDTLDAVRRKEAQYAALASDPEYVKARLLADAWCAAFVWEKRPPSQTLPPHGEGLQSAAGKSPHMRGGDLEGGHFPLPMTDLLYRRMEENPLAENMQTVREYVVELKERYQFFHWHVAFPDVFSVDSPHPKSFSQGEKDFLRRGTRDAELYENIASKAMVEISRDLRQRQTLAEEIVWEALRNRRLNNLKFRRQHPIAETQYVVDFLCYEARLIVEIDGGVHNQQRQADAQRQREIEALGYRVIRFTNDEIYSDLHWVLANIAHAASQPSPNLSQGERNHPSPPGRRAGDEGYNEQTGWNGGFDCVLGNPPWERIKIQEKEWFAERAPEIAAAPNAAARRRMIAELAEHDPYLLQAFADDKRKAEGESHFVRTSERYPLCGRGDVNTYTIFAETSRHIINGYGRVGMIVPSGIATDDTTKFFFQDLMETGSLVSLYDFENRAGLFPAVDSRMKFSLVTMRGSAPTPGPSPSGGGVNNTGNKSLPMRGRDLGWGPDAEFVFFAHSVADLQDDWRRFTLSAQDIAMLNPNTGTMATFRSVRDAEITKAIYRRVPVLIQEEPEINHWGISFLRMFDMSNDSDKFRTREELEAAGFTLRGNHFVDPQSPHPKSLSQGARDLHSANDLPLLHMGEGGGGDEGRKRYLPLYEAKMMHQFTHRWATYAVRLGEMPLEAFVLQPEEARHDVGKLVPRDMTLNELRDPSALVMPRYWVDAREVAARLDFWNQGWLLGFRDIARSTDERTAIFGLIPRVAVGHVMPLIYFYEPHLSIACFVASFDTFVFDYNSRQKIGGTHLTYGYLKQLPVIPPHTYTPALLDFIVPRVLELSYTAWDLQPFAQDVGYDGPPFVWDEERRFLMRCELDALYFHLYQISRDDVDYIMETFPIVKRKDIARTAPTLNPSPSGRGTSSPESDTLPHEGEGPGMGAGGQESGEYITKRIILEMYDQMAALPTMHVPAPKSPPRHEGEGDLGGEGIYAVPDVSQWATWLSPPPASEEVAHKE